MREDCETEDSKAEDYKTEDSKAKDHKPTREDIFHDVENKITIPLSEKLDTNIQTIETLFKNCTDVVKREVNIGRNIDIRIYGVYIDGMVKREVIEQFFLDNIIDYKNDKARVESGSTSLTQMIRERFSATLDIKEVTQMDQVIQAILSGDAAIFAENSKAVLIIAARGWPARGINEPEAEAVVRGSRDGFVETIRFNTVLIRRRIKDTKLKLEMLTMGIRSRTDIALMYIEDIAKPSLIKEVKKRLDKYEIDGVLDSGYIEQLIEESWKSPFPQTQVTERPDKVAASLLEGKIAIIVDNSPFVIVVPTTLNSFYQSSEDYYQRWEIMSFTRILRYVVSFLAFSLPGLYLAILNFHPDMLPTSIAVSIAASREGIAFFSVLEIMIMEIAFELLREAGLRLPGQIGHAIGIVGGIIIGQSAVEAKIISPMIVIIVALTAIATFTIPDYNLTSAFRLIRYVFIAMCALFGVYGFLMALLLLLAHLASLESFKTPYLAPFTTSEANGLSEFKDTLIRFPLFLQNIRPRYARQGQKTRIRVKNSDSTMQTPTGPDSQEEEQN